MRHVIASIALISISLISSVSAQDKASELSRLKQENQRLEAKLQAAELKIQRLEKELAELKSNEADSSEAPNDLFATGTTLTGKRNYTQSGSSSDFQDWKLVIKDRKGNKFEGEISFIGVDGENQTIPVSGTAPAKGRGKVMFQTNQKGLLRQKFTGDLSGGRINLVFSGTGLRGNRVEGTGYLKQ